MGGLGARLVQGRRSWEGARFAPSRVWTAGAQGQDSARLPRSRAGSGAAAQTPGLAAKRTLACAHVFVRVRVCAHACPVQALHLVSEPSLATWYSRWGCPCRRASGQVRVQWHLAWMSGALGFRTQHTLCWARCRTVIETLPGKQVWDFHLP